jgi:hypothetical protein
MGSFSGEDIGERNVTGWRLAKFGAAPTGKNFPDEGARPRRNNTKAATIAFGRPWGRVRRLCILGVDAANSFRLFWKHENE